jgi:hypothetical protein
MSQELPEVIAHIEQDFDWVQFTLTIVTIVLASVAIIVSIITFLNQKQHNISSVKPILNIVSKVDNCDWLITIVNRGLGPAIIKSIFIIDNTDTQHEIDKLLKANFSTSDITTIFQVRQIGEYALKVDDFCSLAAISKQDYPDNQYVSMIQQTKEFLNGKFIHVEYTDLYDRLASVDMLLHVE